MSALNRSRQGEVPEGFHELLPGEAAYHRHTEQTLLNSFRSWAYEEVITPSCEYYHTLMAGSDLSMEEEVYKFFDHKGRILALRPDVTVSVARMVATKLREDDLPFRLCYRAQVYRTGTRPGRLHELGQVGAELIGVRGVAADAEVLGCAMTALEKLGLPRFQVGIGHRELLDALLTTAGLDAHQSAVALEALRKKDLVSLEAVVGKDTLLWDLVAKGNGTRGWGQVLPRLRQELHGQGEMAVDELEAVFSMLKAMGIEHRVFLDVGIVRDLPYYTGTVFDMYAPPIGHAIGGGGRYDGLLAAFGSSYPATGFSLELPAVVKALTNQLPDQEWESKDYYVIGEPDQQAACFAVAARLREKGLAVAIELEPGDLEHCLNKARRRGFKRALYVSEDGYQEHQLEEAKPNPAPDSIH